MATTRRRRALSVQDHVEGVRAGDRAILGRTLTLIESDNPAHFERAQEVLTALLPYTGDAWRVGISGVPGAGKSTFIEAFGTLLTEREHRVAVLAIDPSSTLSGGSILGDKTRMARLSRNERAFIRPSPSSGSLGGVARKTRETMLVCEAAGFDVVLVETVGVGQSEVTVAEMVDFFLVLMIAGAGDELQGIKRGILEVADMLAVNKADGDNVPKARRARRDYANALHFMRPKSPLWTPPVVTASGLSGEGLPEIWAHIQEHHRLLSDAGELQRRRQSQLLRWMWSLVQDELFSALRNDPAVKSRADSLERAVCAQETTATQAARSILSAFRWPS